MALGRVLRCHPFAGAGYDPVVRRTMDEPLQKGEPTHQELETVI